MRTDWPARWPDIKAMRNEDGQGVAHWPGWNMEVLEYLYGERKITASGHETTDTGSGTATSAGDYSLEAFILGKDRYQVELLANLDKVPDWGALVIVAFPKPKGGSGFPARVFAVLPRTSPPRGRLGGLPRTGGSAYAAGSQSVEQGVAALGAEPMHRSSRGKRLTHDWGDRKSRQEAYHAQYEAQAVPR